MGKIRWTEKASNHLQTIHEYIAGDSKTYATRFVRSLIKATTKLETMPHIGRIVPEEIGTDTIKQIILSSGKIRFLRLRHDT